MLCLAISIPSMPVDTLSFVVDGKIEVSSPMRLGSTFTTRIIHSVQLTPVEDVYALAGGEIWGWEERVMSHNAGLPFAAPEHGSFIMRPPWMIVRGGRSHFKRIVYRVGSEELGRNVWILPTIGEVEAFALFPGARAFIEASVEPLALASVVSPQERGR